MNDELHRIRRRLLAVGHASRFRIVIALCERDWHVTELARHIGLSQSCTTRHLQALERVEVIRTRRVGKRVLAALAFERAEVGQIAAWVRVAAGDGASGASDIVRTTPAIEDGRKATSVRRKPTRSKPRRELSPTSDPSSVTPSVPGVGRVGRPDDLDDFLL